MCSMKLTLLQILKIVIAYKLTSITLEWGIAPFGPDLQATKENRYNPKSIRIIFTLLLTSLEVLTIMKVCQQNVLECQDV